MKKNSLLLFTAILCLFGKSFAQVTYPCATTEKTKQYKLEHPEIEQIEQNLEKQIANYISKKQIDKAARTSTVDSVGTDSTWYNIPVVVHVVHDYGAEDLPDNKIYALIAEMNRFYSLRNDTSTVVPEFKKYVGQAKLQFHLATIDPNGNPTKGITHRTSYLTYGGDDQAKFDQWSPTNYVNIWFIARIGQPCSGCVVVAYATQPPSSAINPFYDGIISNYAFIDDATTSGRFATGGSIDHEMGHVMNLYHTFGKTNNPGPSHTDPLTNYSGFCGDDDGVDDTPPTDGCLGCCNLYDTVCSQNYYKIYTNIAGGDSLVNYPDTANEQNIMNYASCKVMFTKGQIARMHAALNSDVAGRNNLWQNANLAATGAMAPTPDLAPIPDFSVKNVGGVNTYFTCPGVPLKFTNQSWNDTVVAVTWNFTNGASTATVTASESVTSANNVSSVVNNSFTTPGWVSVTLSATGNNTGTTTKTDSQAVFVADPVGISPIGYVQDFKASGDRAKWPLFNYYNNNFKWQINDAVGFYDNSSIEYVGYDSRIYPENLLGLPAGDYDDFFSIPVDLSSFSSGGKCNLNYFYSGAARTGATADINDSMVIQYSTDSSKTWKSLTTLSKTTLDNKGSSAMAYVPQYASDWSPMSISIPASARTNYTIFRFRYFPGINGTNATGQTYSTGNNFYMDHIYFSDIPASVTNTTLNNIDVAVIPNPTTSDAYVVVKDQNNATAKVIVSDVTGKVVYTVSEQITGSEAHILIPHTAIGTQGLYMVQVVTGNQVQTKKLVVY